MKQNQCIETANIRKLNIELQKVWDRPKHELAGILVVTGMKGTGKSRCVHSKAITNNHVYIRLESKDSVRSFFSKLNHVLEYYQKQGMYLNIDKEEHIVHGVSIHMVDRCIRILAQHPELTIYIDEFDYALEREKKQLLDSIRDICDKTMATFVLVGMEDTKNLLFKRSKPLFDRVMAFVEFQPWDKKDTVAVSAGIADVNVTDKVGSYIYDTKTNAGGSARQVIHTISGLEVAARNKTE